MMVRDRGEKRERDGKAGDGAMKLVANVGGWRTAAPEGGGVAAGLGGEAAGRRLVW